MPEQRDADGVPIRESLPEWRRLKLAKLELALGIDALARLNAQERRILCWVAGFDDWTVDGVIGMFLAVRKGPWSPEDRRRRAAENGGRDG